MIPLDLILKINLPQALQSTSHSETRIQKIDIEKYNKIVSERDRVSKAERKQRLIKAISYYSLASESLGWINCDRFINNPNKRINMNIIAKSKNEKFMFLFKRV